MFTQEFWDKRAQFPPEELAKYRGQWVAFSADGSRIVANAATLEALEDRLEAAGEDAQLLMLEGVPGPEEDTFLGGQELR
jgi:hypothetical protein